MNISQEQFNKSINAIKNVELSMSEQANMKRVILNQSVVTSNIYSLPKKTITGVTLFFFASATLAFGAQYSEPGDFLYELETEVIEPAIGMFYTGDEYMQYQEDLARERVEEVFAVRAEGSASEEDISIAEQQFNEHIAILESGYKRDQVATTVSVAARSTKASQLSEINSLSDTDNDIEQLISLFALAVSETLHDGGNTKDNKIDSLAEHRELETERSYNSAAPVNETVTVIVGASTSDAVLVGSSKTNKAATATESMVDIENNSTNTNNTEEKTKQNDADFQGSIEFDVSIEQNSQIQL